jgi:hypothetical protein
MPIETPSAAPYTENAFQKAVAEFRVSPNFMSVAIGEGTTLGDQ